MDRRRAGLTDGLMDLLADGLTDRRAGGRTDGRPGGGRADGSDERTHGLTGRNHFFSQNV